MEYHKIEGQQLNFLDHYKLILDWYNTRKIYFFNKNNEFLMDVSTFNLTPYESLYDELMKFVPALEKCLHDKKFSNKVEGLIND
jgi:hypothetical protein